MANTEVYIATRSLRSGSNSPLVRWREFWAGDIGYMDFCAGMGQFGWGCLEAYHPAMMGSTNFQILMWIYPHPSIWAVLIASAGFTQAAAAVYGNMKLREWMSGGCGLLYALLAINLMLALKGPTPGFAIYAAMAGMEWIVNYKFTGRRRHVL